MDPLLRLLGASDLVLPYSRQYAQYVLLAAPFMGGSFVLNQGLRAEGNAIFSMFGMIFGAILNIGLDPIFIFAFHWGVAGASAATAISKIGRAHV
jgi:Na+-driven multidrug efflux pump